MQRDEDTRIMTFKAGLGVGNADKSIPRFWLGCRSRKRSHIWTLQKLVSEDLRCATALGRNARLVREGRRDERPLSVAVEMVCHSRELPLLLQR